MTNIADLKTSHVILNDKITTMENAMLQPKALEPNMSALINNSFATIKIFKNPFTFVLCDVKGSLTDLGTEPKAA